jgi:hypothetical protein
MRREADRRVRVATEPERPARADPRAADASWFDPRVTADGEDPSGVADGDWTADGEPAGPAPPVLEPDTCEPTEPAPTLTALAEVADPPGEPQTSQ